MILDNDILKHLKDNELPEAIKESLLTQFFAERREMATSHLEKEKLAFEKKKFRWNTPIVATLTGILTLGVTYVFDVWKAENKTDLAVVEGAEQTKNTITLEQLKAEIAESETRLTQSFQERQKKTEAEYTALAEERAFQFNLVKEQLATKIDQSERARVLLFLAKSGILSTLNVSYLEELANEQLNSGQSVIPKLNVSSDAVSWSDLNEPKNSRLWDVGGATVKLDGLTSGGSIGVCSGFFVGPNQLVTTDHCVGGFSRMSALTGYYSNADISTIKRYTLYDLTAYSNLGAGSALTSETADSVLKIADDDELRIGLPLALIHYPEGGIAKVSRCSVVKLVDDEILHNCDTIGGSSGGPLLSEISLNVVGFHFAGATPMTDESIIGSQVGMANRAKIFNQSVFSQIFE